MTVSLCVYVKSVLMFLLSICRNQAQILTSARAASYSCHVNHVSIRVAAQIRENMTKWNKYIKSLHSCACCLSQSQWLDVTVRSHWWLRWLYPDCNKPHWMDRQHDTKSSALSLSFFFFLPIIFSLTSLYWPRYDKESFKLTMHLLMIPHKLLCIV